MLHFSILPDSSGLICLIRAAIAGVILGLPLGSEVLGSSVSMGARVSPSSPMPSKSPVVSSLAAEFSTSPSKIKKKKKNVNPENVITV